MQTALMSNGEPCSRKGRGWLWQKAGLGTSQTKHGRLKVDVHGTCGDLHVQTCLQHRHPHTQTQICGHAYVHVQTHMYETFMHKHTHTFKKFHTPRGVHTHANSHRMPSSTPNSSLDSHRDPRTRSHAYINACVHTQAQTCLSSNAEYLSLA